MTFKMKEEAQTITIYNLRADTKEFIGASDACIPSHTGLPAYCTDIEPMEVPAGKVAIFNSSKSIWSLVDDYRGKTVFDTVTGNAMYITELGLLPENTTLIAPNGQYQKWNGKAWVKDEEAEKSAMLSEATAKKNSLMQVANERIATLQDSVELEMATDDEKKKLTDWKTYRVLLSRVDPAVADWPALPE
jgi:hypothetical protein